MSEHQGTRITRGQHNGPCLNYENQDPSDYNEHDSCYLHIQAAERSHQHTLEMERLAQDAVDAWRSHQTGWHDAAMLKLALHLNPEIPETH